MIRFMVTQRKNFKVVPSFVSASSSFPSVVSVFFKISLNPCLSVCPTTSDLTCMLRDTSSHFIYHLYMPQFHLSPSYLKFIFLRPHFLPKSYLPRKPKGSHSNCQTKNRCRSEFLLPFSPKCLALINLSHHSGPQFQKTEKN